MDDTALLHTSRREHTLYRELTAVYHAMASALRDERASVDPTWLAAAHGRAEATSAALRNMAAALAPHRLTGARVPAEAAELWRDSARLAAEAATLNAELLQLARARQTVLAARLQETAVGRRALAGYRPPASAGVLSDQRV